MENKSTPITFPIVLSVTKSNASIDIFLQGTLFPIMIMYALSLPGLYLVCLLFDTRTQWSDDLPAKGIDT